MGPTFGVMLSFHHLESLNFLTGGPTFSFCSGPCKFRNWSCTDLISKNGTEVKKKKKVLLYTRVVTYRDFILL